MQLPVSVVTIVKNRTEKLCRLIKQLESCNPLPNELVIVWMSPPSNLSLIKSSKFAIVHKFSINGSLPIARARNKGMVEAKSNLLAYVDVDAVLASHFLATGLNAWKPSHVVISSVTRVPTVQWPLAYAALNEMYHSTTSENPKNKTSETQEEDHHGKLSDDSSASAVFFISKTDFKKTGGFDEGYEGYGLNDEDFFTNCRSLGFHITTIALRTFVPERKNSLCPINHLLDFVKNAERFHAKWGQNPRIDVLRAYANAGYINQDFETAGIHIIQLPKLEPTEQSLAPKQSSPGNSSINQSVKKTA